MSAKIGAVSARILDHPPWKRGCGARGELLGRRVAKGGSRSVSDSPPPLGGVFSMGSAVAMTEKDRLALATGGPKPPFPSEYQ